MNPYTATVERSGGWWAISITGIPFAHTQTRRLSEVENAAREVLVDLGVESGAEPMEVRIERPPRRR